MSDTGSILPVWSTLVSLAAGAAAAGGGTGIGGLGGGADAQPKVKETHAMTGMKTTFLVIITEG